MQYVLFFLLQGTASINMYTSYLGLIVYLEKYVGFLYFEHDVSYVHIFVSITFVFNSCLSSLIGLLFMESVTQPTPSEPHKQISKVVLVT